MELVLMVGDHHIQSDHRQSLLPRSGLQLTIQLPSTSTALLDPALKKVDEIRGLMLITEPDRGLSAYPVAPLVNSTANNGSHLIDPIELGEPETLF